MVKYEIGMGGMTRNDPPCPRCHSSDNVRMKGKWKFDLGDGAVQIVQRYHCRTCNFHFHIEPRICKREKKQQPEVRRKRFLTTESPEEKRIRREKSKIEKQKRLEITDPEKSVRSKSCCVLLKHHHEILKNDPDRLPTEFIKEISKCDCKEDKNDI